MNQGETIQITPRVHWVGVENPELRTFDVVMHTDYGTTYNSYLVKGSGGIAVVESVKDRLGAEGIERILSLCSAKDVQYIILDHVEPDHSSALPQYIKAFPNATVLCSRAASAFLKDLVGVPFPCRVVSHQETLSLGDLTLQFLSTPNLHWPDSMCTFVVEEKVLISGDIFGCHYAPICFDDTCKDDLSLLLRDYFDAIMAPFKTHMLSAMETIAPLDPKVLCPSHGPVIRADVAGAISRMRVWSEDVLSLNEPPKVALIYASCYGYTAALGHEMASVLRAEGLEVCELDVAIPENIDKAIACANKADGVLLGSSTLNRDALPPLWQVASALGHYAVKGKPGGAFGSYAWSGEAVPMLEARLASLGMVSIASGVRCKMKPHEKQLQEAADYARAFARKILEQRDML